MDWNIAASVLGAAVAAAVLASAACSDVRTRHASDRHWAALCIAGVPLAAVRVACADGPAPGLLYLSGCALMAAYMLSHRLIGVRAAPVVASSCVLIASSACMSPTYGLCLALVPVWSLTVLALYLLGNAMGGADAKCMVSLSMALPVWPCIPGLPLLGDPWICPPLLPTVAAFAAVLCPVWLLRTAVLNLRGGRTGSMLHIRIPVAEADPSFHWPAEEAVDGRIVPCRPCGRLSGDRIESLRAIGAETVAVSPTVPFLAPLFGGLVMALVLGTPFS